MRHDVQKNQRAKATLSHRERVTSIVVLAFACISSFASADDDVSLRVEQAVRAAVERVAPCVVRIDTIGGSEHLGRMLLGTGPTTGLIVDAKGFIVSSAFNFLNRPTSILVRLPGGARKAARLVASDHSRRLVLLKIETAEPLSVPEFAPGAELRVGQWTIAVGRAFEGERPNVALGILSALRRVWGKALQTDAAVSPNNYGGPLVDLRGRVLGVLVPMSPQSDTEVSGIEWYDSGIGFAVDADYLRMVLPKLEAGEDVHRGLLGVSFASQELQMEEPVLAAVQPQSPAAAAGLKSGDRIVEVDGRKIDWASQVREETSRRYAGQKVRMTVLRGKERITREIELAAKLPTYVPPFLGVLPQRAADAKTKGEGLAVRYVYPQGPAERAGIRAGDRIVALDDTKIANRGEVLARLFEYAPQSELRVELDRDGQRVKKTVRLDRLPEALPPDALPPAHDAIPANQEKAKTGAFQVKIPELANETWACVPTAYVTAVPHGLVLWLRGEGGGEPKEFVARWKPLCDRHDLIVVATKANGDGKWQPGQEDVVKRILREMVRNYTIDAARVVIAGQGTGATLAGATALAGRDALRGAMLFPGDLPEEIPEPDPAFRQAFLLDQVTPAAEVARLRDAKYPVTLFPRSASTPEFDDQELGILARWIDMLDRI